ncbi:MAG: type II toxin-antitoxin system RelE/ParE family toxin [Pyrinomonadaceae bacterium]
MESYKIQWKHSAVKELKQLPKETIRKIYSAVDELSQNPYVRGSKKLVDSENNFRIRVGNYRIIYSVISKILIVEIISVGHRKDVYR